MFDSARKGVGTPGLEPPTGIDIARRLSAADPDDTAWQRLLVISHGRLGEDAAVPGDLGAARPHHRAAPDPVQQADRRKSDHHPMAAGLSVIHHRPDNVAVTVGDMAAARSH